MPLGTCLIHRLSDILCTYRSDIFSSRGFHGHRELLLRPLVLAAACVVAGYLIGCLASTPSSTGRVRYFRGSPKNNNLGSARRFERNGFCLYAALLMSALRKRFLRFNFRNLAFEHTISSSLYAFRVVDMSSGCCHCLIGQRYQLESTAKQLNQRNISFRKTSLEDYKHCSSDVASVEVAFLRHQRSDASVEALQRVCADHDAEAEDPQVRSVYENLCVTRQTLLRDVRGCPCVVRAVGEKRARSAFSFC